MDNEYQLSTLKKLDTLPLGIWYQFKSKGHKEEDLLEIIKIRIDLSRDFIISNDYKMFKRIKHIKASELSDQITYKIEFRNQEEVEFDYSHLEVKIKKHDGKKSKRRAT